MRYAHQIATPSLSQPTANSRESCLCTTAKSHHGHPRRVGYDNGRRRGALVPSKGSSFDFQDKPLSMSPVEAFPPFGPMTTFQRTVPAGTYLPLLRKQLLLKSREEGGVPNETSTVGEKL